MKKIRTKNSNSTFRFQRVGGSLQLQLKSASDIKKVPELDEAFWAVTGIEVDALRFDRKFLNFVDSDSNGTIRTDEVKEALDFLIRNMKDLSGTVAASPVLSLDGINSDTAEGAAIIAAAELILSNLGRAGERSITVDEILNDKGGVFHTRSNGDGIIVPEADFPAELVEAVTLIQSSGRSSNDLSGQAGVSAQDIASFTAAATAKVAYLAELENDPALTPYGENSVAYYQIYDGVAGIIDSYFLNTQAYNFLSSEPERTVKRECVADLMIPDEVRKVLMNSAAARPTGNDVLDFSDTLNPVYAEKLTAFAALPPVAGVMDGTKLSFAAWKEIKAKFAPYAAWLGRAVSDDGLANISVDELKKFLGSGVAEKLTALAQNDLGYAAAVAANSALLKLALYQSFMLEFLNNFVSLSALFNPGAVSRLQMGKLVLDGRHFTLTVPVKNVAVHKRIVKTSDICVIYVNISRGVPGAVVKNTIAVAVTNGSMRRLFIGKRGVFFDVDGLEYDAEIFDMIEQPVSVSEALKAPFFRFAEFVGKQAEKLFNTRNAEAQKAIGAELNTGLNSSMVQPGKAAAKPVPAAAAQQSSPAGALPMLLMGGGIGIAALGSSIAFIARSIHNISVWSIIAAIAGIVVIFGGPMVVISLIKLFRRDLARFLESTGCAVNTPMRLSHKMGLIFTFTPLRPSGSFSGRDLIDMFSDKEGQNGKGRSTRFWWWLLAAALLLGSCCGAATIHYMIKKKQKTEVSAVEPKVPVKDKQPENKKSVPADKAGTIDNKNQIKQVAK